MTKTSTTIDARDAALLGLLSVLWGGGFILSGLALRDVDLRGLFRTNGRRRQEGGSGRGTSDIPSGSLQMDLARFLP